MVGSTSWTAFGYVKPCPLRGTAPETTQINGGYQICKHCMLSTQLRCSSAWALAFIQSHKLEQFTPTQKPHGHYNEGEGLCTFEPCCKKGQPLSCTPHVYVLAQGAHRKTVEFFPKICSTYLVIFIPLDHFLRDLSFFKWRCINTSLAQKIAN